MHFGKCPSHGTPYLTRRVSGMGEMPFCPSCEQERVEEDRHSDLLDAMRSNPLPTPDGECACCGQYFIEKFRRKHVAGHRWTGLLERYADSGVCPLCYNTYGVERELAVEWTEEEWKTHRQAEQAAAEAARIAKREQQREAEAERARRQAEQRERAQRQEQARIVQEIEERQRLAASEVKRRQDEARLAREREDDERIRREAEFDRQHNLDANSSFLYWVLFFVGLVAIILIGANASNSR